MTTLAPALVRAYREARYEVDGDLPLTLQVDAYSEALAALMTFNGVDSAAYVTAFNPGGARTEAALNTAADARLHAQLQAAGWRAVRASGHDPRGEWPDEPGWLVLGVTAAQADALGQAFGQNAVLHAGEDAIVHLRLLR